MALTLILLLLVTRKRKELKAIVDGKDKAFGIISKVIVKKNHINSVKNTGEFVIVSDKIFANEPGAIKDYKEANREKWGQAEIVESEPTSE